MDRREHSMGNVKIIADSTCDLSDELKTQYDIQIIPLMIELDHKSYLDGIEIKPDNIYEWSDRNGTTPKTASPQIGVIIDCLKHHQMAKDTVIFFGISEDMSVTCQSVRTAASELEYKEVYIINSMNLSTGIGLLILQAAKMVQQNIPVEQIVANINDLRNRVRASFVVDTLTYLHRGGRCSAVTALLGNTLRLKPMIVVKNGKMGVAKKYRGRQSMVVLHYVEELKSQLLKADPSCVFITHSGIAKEIETSVYEWIQDLHYFKEVYVTRAGGVISSHCGPNTLGVLFIEGNS